MKQGMWRVRSGEGCWETREGGQYGWPAGWTVGRSRSGTNVRAAVEPRPVVIFLRQWPYSGTLL